MLNTLCHRYAGRMSMRTVSCVLHAIGATLAAAILMTGIVAYGRLDAHCGRLRAECHRASTTLARAAEIAQRRDQSEAALAAARQREQQVHRRIPDQAGEIQFLDQLTQLAQQSGLQIRDYRPGARHQHPTHQETELVLRLEGSYEGLCQFAAGLQRLPRMCRIGNLSLTAPQAGKSSMAMELRITLAHSLQAPETA
ncbi:type IV pilus inner membrane component PilO [Roseimaritima sediminicola]|uniref:type 4a pilus biogenesis protein PilO n=1 Tax=Roseimaritima sediminicola TaxID=2662066 RepID=UPI001386C94C|nr:type 4a pilus biogenesis protein PilO [Roseimaritima sediminicola]